MTTSPYYDTDRHKDGGDAAEQLWGLLRGAGLLITTRPNKFTPWSFSLIDRDPALEPMRWASWSRPSLQTYLRQGYLVMDESKLKAGLSGWVWHTPDLQSFAWTTKSWLDDHPLERSYRDGRWDRARPDQRSFIVEVPTSLLVVGNDHAFLSFLVRETDRVDL